MSSEIRTIMPVHSEAQQQAIHQLGMARKGLCPFCGSSKVHLGELPEDIFPTLWQVELPFACGDCPKVWSTTYEMIRVEEV